MQRVWFDRKFTLGFPIEAFPDVLERVRGTPARLEERLSPIPSKLLGLRPNNDWSILDHVGHLGDLESLWSGRLEDLLGRALELRPADLENRATHEADHHTKEAAELLARFRRQRERIVEQLEALPEDWPTRTAEHPRLRQPMTVVDLFFFVAEHDDHHLAKISGLLRPPLR